MVKDDYGVDGCPGWYEAVNIELLEGRIFDIIVDHTAFPKSVIDTLFDLSGNADFEELEDVIDD